MNKVRNVIISVFFLILMDQPGSMAVHSNDHLNPVPPAEESGNLVRPSDQVVTGMVGEVSSIGITVDSIFYSHCQGVKAFTHLGGAMGLGDLDAALEVKLIVDQNRGCVRKINVVRFAQ